MRGRNIRLSILILIVLSLSIAALAFHDVNVAIPGLTTLARSGTGPLGLKLGLDLRGGGHLVYQADTSTQIALTFAGGIVFDPGDVREVLSKQGIKVAKVEPVTPSNTFRIQTALLNEAQLAGLREAINTDVGAVATLEASDEAKATVEQMEGAVSIIARRVNLFGTEEPIIQRFGDDRIIVQLPGAAGSVAEVEFGAAATPTTEMVREAVAGAGLEGAKVDQRGGKVYRIRASTLDEAKRAELRQTLQDKVGVISTYNVTSGIDDAKKLIGITARLEFKERTCTDQLCTNFIDRDIGLSGDDLDNAFAAQSPNTGEWVVDIQFNDRGAEIFSDLTRSIANKSSYRIAVFLDDEEIIAPVARAHIRDGRSEISGNFTRESARNISIQLESGRLPVPLKLVQESEVDALLGSASLQRSLMAGMVGLGLVLVFMVAYYRMAGVVAAIALVFYSLLMLAIVKLIPVTLTLPGIAGFILSIGMAVDANVLIFERMKEEIRIGRTLASSMEVGFSRAWPAIRDGNATIFISCGILLWFGNRLGGQLVTGFALTLFIGTVVSVFTAISVSRNLLQLLAWAGMSRQINLFTPEGGARPVAVAGGKQ
ncbi:MAG: protein translocase subunit SecD [Dehalococcoidia bacterium]|nr:protein translocase subunit SecD [Dehalococcoidia bacterium]MSQ16696.1 protein translocase subunit SecD [Dehalococcoidia bacterium]